MRYNRYMAAVAWIIRALLVVSEKSCSIGYLRPRLTSGVAFAASSIKPSDRSRRSLALYSSDRINGEGKNPDSRRPQTGWNHNLPKDESDFWKGPRDEKNSASSETTRKAFRTGWLHSNVKPSATDSTMDRSAKGEAPGTNTARRRLELAKLQRERNHRLISPPTFHACGEDRLVASTEHIISVPIWKDGGRSQMMTQRIDVYFCVVETVVSEETRRFLQVDLSNTTLSPNQRAIMYVEHLALQNADDMILYLQGGPGFGAPAPVVSLGIGKGSGSWADAALYDAGYRRIVLMDQRGTGKSSPITKQTLERQFPDLFLLDESASPSTDILQNGRSIEEFSPSQPDLVSRVQSAVKQVTEYLSQFRADNIVQDAERIREALLLPPPLDANTPDNQPPKPWGCSLGQSYGGFCQMTYLSFVKDPPRLMLFTGGIAPILWNIDQVYDKLWDRVKERNLRFYEMYPGDIVPVKQIVQALLKEPVSLPCGGRLTARRFLSLGISLGGTPSSFASLHELIASVFVGGPKRVPLDNSGADLEFSRAFLKQIEIMQSFDDHPIYFWLHESIYANGPDQSPTNWAAEGAFLRKLSEEPSEFDYRRTSQIFSQEDPTLFFGEHVFSWMTEDFVELSGVGLRAVANNLAAKTDWGRLYDEEHIKMVLSDGRTRSAAAVYLEDMYVEFEASMKVAAREGPLGKCKVYVTNEYQHSGLRDNGAALFNKLHGMAKGGTRIPS
jgi:hypothetical protein